MPITSPRASTARAVTAALVVLLLTACGAALQRESRGVEGITSVTLIGPSLVGASLSIDGASRTIRKEDLTPYRMGVLGAADQPDEGFERLEIELTPAEHDLRMTRTGSVLFERTIYLGDGQRREFRL